MVGKPPAKTVRRRPTSDPSNGDIMRAIGRLEEGQANAKEGRSALQDTLNNHAELISTVSNQLSQASFNLKVVADIAVQARDAVQKLDEEVKPALAAATAFHQEAEPVVKNMRRASMAIAVAAGMIALTGIGAGSALAFANDQVREIVRTWLDYP